MPGTAIRMAVLLAAGTLTGCDGDAKRAAADTLAANFVPPSVLSRADFTAQADRRFRRLDRDGDDVIEAAEIPPANRRLKGLDRNGDGEITQSEFSEGLLARFDKMDLNHDGTVTSDERQAAKGAL